MRKIMFLILAIGTLIIVTSCSDKNELEGTKPPIPVINLDSVDIPVVRGTYCWYECAEYPSIPEIVEKIEPTVVPATSKFTISFLYTPRPSNISIARMKQGEEKLYNQSLVTPSEQGVYYYEIDARWNYDDLVADSYYAFVIEVK
ncbi:hypothetical protein LG311_03530 [Sutcliffiella horikoshii]|uniref:hypothetical protein n=1 Tax=Sutcliffiella horikoshii TaxID=79883 RepID=UPI00384B1936